MTSYDLLWSLHIEQIGACHPFFWNLNISMHMVPAILFTFWRLLQFINILDDFASDRILVDGNK
jgi:hypothetical protein